MTGSNTGLGLEAARHFARLNASLVILAVRDLSKGEAARQSILASTSRSQDAVEVWPLDLQSFDSVKAFAARASKLARIDGLLENAGIQADRFKLVEGYESVITTNVISTFLLALLMLPKLRETARKFKTQPRLTIVASDVHFLASFPERQSTDIFAALNDEKTAKMGWERYSTSKLIQVLVVRELGARLSGRAPASKASASESPPEPQAVVNCLTPGLCYSGLGRDQAGLQTVFFASFKALVARSTEVGSRTLVDGIVKGAESQGAYIADCQVAE